MEMNKTIQELGTIQENKMELEAKRSEFISDDIMVEFQEKINNVSLEEIDQMSGQELIELNTKKDGTKLIDVPNIDEDKQFNYLRDMYIYFKKSEDLIKKLDDSLVELNMIVKESKEAVSKIGRGCKDDASIIKSTRASLEKAVSMETDPDLKARVEESLEAFEDALTFNRLKEIYSKINKDNVKNDAMKFADTIYQKYKKAIIGMGLKFDMCQLADLELKYLPEEYHDRNNMFIFMCMRYISKLTVHRGMKKTNDGFFVSQLSTNLYLLSLDTLDEEDKQTLITNMKEVLDLLK